MIAPLVVVMSKSGGYSLGDTSVKTSLKYGLNPAAKRKNLPQAKPKPLKGPIAAFADVDSDDEDATAKARGNVEVRKQQNAAKHDSRVSEFARAFLSIPRTVARCCLAPWVLAHRSDLTFGVCALS